MGTDIPTPAIGNSFQGTLEIIDEVDAEDLTSIFHKIRINPLFFYWAF